MREGIYKYPVGKYRIQDQSQLDH